MIDFSNGNLTSLDQLHGKLSNSKVQTIILKKNNIEDVAPQDVLYFTSISSLDISFNKLIDINFVNNLENLVVLDLSHNHISNFKLTFQNSKLQKLVLSHNNISYIFIQYPLKTLFYLEANHNSITNLDFAFNLPSIQELYLNSNLLTSIEKLEHNSKLQKLAINDNNISDFTPFPIATLLELDISDNKIKDLHSFAQLSHLQSLKLSNNKISDKSLKNSTELRELVNLDISSNPISIPAYILNFAPNLQTVDISNTNIAEESKLIKFLESAKNLAFINFHGTPLMSSAAVSIINIEEGCMADVSSIKAGLENKKAIDELENQNKALRNEILGLLYDKNQDPCAIEIISSLQRENELIKKLLFEKRSQSANSSNKINQSLPKFDEKVQTSAIQKIICEDKSTQRDLSQNINANGIKSTETSNLDHKVTKKDKISAPSLSNSDQDADYQKYIKRRDRLLRHFGENSAKRSFDSLIESNSDLVSIIHELEGNESKINKIEQICTDNVSKVANIIGKKRHKHRHKHIHHHFVKIPKEKEHKNILVHHHPSYYGEQEMYSDFDEEKMDSYYDCPFCPISSKTVEQHKAPKVSRKPQIILADSLSLTPEYKSAKLELKPITGFDVDTMRLPYWEELSSFVDLTPAEEEQIFKKPLKNCWPFTQMEPRAIPWDYYVSKSPATRPNPHKDCRRISMQKIVDYILANARIDNNYNESIKSNSKEAELIKIWVRFATGKNIHLENIQRAPNASKIAKILQHKPKLGLIHVKNGPAYLRMPGLDNTVIQINSISYGEYVLCAYYGGRMAKDKHENTVPSKVLMSVVTRAGYDSLIFGRRGNLKICVNDGANVVPIYSFVVM